jgi:uncharacterized protein YebE (UPF0316 family)
MNLTPEAWLTVLLIFVLRVFNVGIGTFRLVIIARGQRLLAAVLGFVESAAFAYTIANVAADLSNLPNFLAYCGGFSVGSYVGMWVESMLIRSFVSVNVFAREGGSAIAAALRAAGFGVTVTQGEGRDGEVTLLRSIMSSRDSGRALNIIREVQDNAFVSVEPAVTVYRGYLGRQRPTDT